MNVLAINLDPFSGIAQDMINAVTSWVAGGAAWVLQQVVAMIQQNTAVNLSGAWFMAHYETMAALSAFVMVPMLLLAAFRGAISGNPGSTAATAFLYIPLAVFGIAVAVPLVDMLLAVVDWMCSAMTQTLAADFNTFAANLSTALTGDTSSIAQPFIIFICALMMVVFGLLIFVELLFRDAAVYAVAVFIPLAFSVMIFPSTAAITKRLFDGLIGLIFYKFFIVAVFAVGVSALGATTGTGGGFTTVLAGLVILILAAVLPNLLIGYLPVLEGAALASMAARSASRSAAAAPAATSESVYRQIRRTNESRVNGGSSGSGSSSGSGGGFTSGGSNVALSGMSQRQQQAPLLGGAGAAPAGGSSGGGGVPTSPGGGGIGPVGSPGSAGGAGGSGASGASGGQGGVLGGGVSGTPGPQGPAGPRGPAGPPGESGQAVSSGGLSVKRPGGGVPQAGSPTGNGG